MALFPLAIESSPGPYSTECCTVAPGSHFSTQAAQSLLSLQGARSVYILLT